MKKQLRNFERQWWDKRLVEWQEAAERIDFGSMYSLLRTLGTRSSKPLTGTKLTTQQFKDHFENISFRRYENEPSAILQAVSTIEDKSNDTKRLKSNDLLTMLPSEKEILDAINELKDSAPGRDKVRVRYIKEACSEIKWNVVELTQSVFEQRADKWNASVKIGQIVPLFKKGDRENTGNNRGVCLLSMISKILARVLAKRLREWTEENGILDENQSGFRPGRAKADATEIIIRIQEDMSFIKRCRKALKIPTPLPSDPVGRFLDLQKAYQRVSKAALWEILRRHGMRGTFLNCLMDLHETTAYVVKGKEGDSDHWIPQRGVREGCPTSPVLFNVFH